MTNKLLDEAIKYVVEKNWFVFPTREKPYTPLKNGEPIIIKSGKDKGKPLVLKVKSPYVKSGFKECTQDINQIKEWWKRFPNAGIGISCGHSNIVVVDIDVKGGRKGFDNFMKMEVPDEGALHATTPSGGLHIIYSGNMSSHANVKAGVDIRSQGGYIVAPPSWIWLDGQKKTYVALDDWTRTPIQFPEKLEEKFQFLSGKKTTEKKEIKIYKDKEIQDMLPRIKEALNNLEAWYCDDYFMWIRVGMALKGLGNSGFELWKEWSKKSEKYDEEALEYRWEKFNPNEITIASIFYYAKESLK